jgi:predicted hotdog family 3-hydroxylacyl-ACP dehydratase
VPLNKADFAHLIPHQGGMSLLDRVEEFDEESIVCASSSHRSPENPLRRAGRLSALAGIEYAAQAMAVHGALLAQRDGRGAAAGYLALARDVELPAERLDDVAEDLRIRAFRLAAQPDSLMYGFEITAGGRVLLRGRVAVFFPEPGLQTALFSSPPPTEEG